jgi:hypothetical protein
MCESVRVKVFLLSRRDADTTYIKRVLRANDVELVSGPFDQRGNDKKISAGVLLLDSRGGSGLESLIFEGGVAVGQGIPLMVIVERNFGLDLALLRYPDVRFVTINDAAVDIEALDFHLGLFVAEMRAPRNAGSLPIARTTKHRGERAELLEGYTSAKPKTWSELEKTVGQMFEATGSEVAIARHARDRGFDLATTVRLSSTNSAVLLVEVKGNPSLKSFTDSGRRLGTIARNEKAELGLIVVEHWTGDLRHASLPENVAALDLAELAEAVGRDDLGDTLLKSLARRWRTS